MRRSLLRFCCLSSLLWGLDGGTEVPRRLKSALPGEPTRFERVEPVMGTLFRVTIYAVSRERATAALDDAFARARQLDAILSDYKQDSELNRLCRFAGKKTPVSPELFAVLATAIEVARNTRGAFDPTVGPVVRLWREARRTNRLPAPSAVAAARKRTGWKRVRLDRASRAVSLTAPDMQLDLGGIAKGFAADEMLAVLARQHGITSALVAASGDLAIGDPPPGRSGWDVSLQGGETRTLARCGVSTSGDSEQFVVLDGVRYSHIVDPRAAGIGVTRSFPVTVVASSGILADSLATAFSVMGPKHTKAWSRTWPDVQWIVHSGEKQDDQRC